jgi:8-oxo-dGTP pyrophosphatase MutT (NUDIX family)
VGTAVSDVVIHQVHDLDLAFEPWEWSFAQERRADIAANFAARQHRANGGLWNGRVLMMHRCEIGEGVVRGAYFETDFASFMAWRDFGCPDTRVYNCFAMAALRSCDGAFLLGVMGAHTANAGRVYFPGGTPDPNDVIAGRVDLAGSLVRELREETGLELDDVVAAPVFHVVAIGQRIAVLRILDAPQPALALRERIRAHCARETQPELVDMRIVRGPGDLDASKMPDFVIAFLEGMWR